MRFFKSNTCRDWTHATCYNVNIVVSFIEFFQVFKCIQLKWFKDVLTTVAIRMFIFQIVELFVDANSRNVRGQVVAVNPPQFKQGDPSIM